VRCLFCPRRFDCENPRGKKLVDEYIKDIENELKRLTPPGAMEALRVQGEQLKARAIKTGVSDASILLAIGTK
jgi:hypothetical protein